MKKIVRNYNKAEGSADLYIYDEIGFWGIDAKEAIEEINALGDVSKFNLHVNSPGGVISDGIAIYNAIKRHKANVTTYVDGLAASIASVFALAGDEIVMAEGALFMIHDPWSIVIGDAPEMRKEADVLDTHKETILGIYENATGRDRDEIAQWMSDETWMRGSEAVEKGFAHRVEGEVKAAACVRPDAVNRWFSHAPENIKDFIKKDSLNTESIAGNDTNSESTEEVEDEAPNNAGAEDSTQETPPQDASNDYHARQAVYEKLTKITT